jgi:hypothetical protein
LVEGSICIFWDGQRTSLVADGNSDGCVNFFSTCGVFGLGATIVPSDGSADCLESVVEGDVSYDLADDQEDRKGGNGDLKGFFAFFLWE